MLATISAINDWADGWLTTIWAVAWQFALVAVVATLIAWLLRRSSPAVRYWLWQIVAVKLLLMPFWVYAVPLPSWAETRPIERAVVLQPATMPGNDLAQPADPTAVVTDDAAGKAAAPEAEPFWAPLLTLTWHSWLLVVWFAVVVWQCIRLFVQRLRLASLLRQGVVENGPLAGLVADMARQIGLRRVPEVVLVAGDCPLFVCGLWRSRLVAPERLMAALGLAERRQVILHELSHIKRRDLAWGWPIEIARIVYFFHPLVYCVAYHLRLERELACDQLAMSRSGNSAADYAQTLVQVVTHASEPAALQQVAAISAGLTGNETPRQQGK